MKTFSSLALAFSGLMATVAAHGVIVSPPRRAPGTQMAAVCGSTIYNNQASDNAGPIQLLMQSESSIVDTAACNLWLCKGYQFEDNKDQVQSYTLGQTVPMEVNIVAPHTGYANVSIVDTKTNTIKGSELKSWSVYASTATGVTADDTNFSITIPTDLDGCTTAGDCVIQWYWYSPPSVDQAYEGCIDFVVTDGTAATTSAAATTTAAATTSAAVEVPTTTDVEVPTTTAVEVPTTTAVEVPTTTAVEVPTTTAVEVPTTTAVEVPTTAVEVPTTTAVEVPTTSSAPIESSPTSTKAPAQTTSKAVIPTSSTKVVVPTSVPTTLITKTRSKTSAAFTKTSTSAAAAATTSAAVSTGCSKTSADYNKCLDAVNMCIRNAQSKTGGAVDFSSCETQRSACTMC